MVLPPPHAPLAQISRPNSGCRRSPKSIPATCRASTAAIEKRYRAHASGGMMGWSGGGASVALGTCHAVTHRASRYTWHARTHTHTHQGVWCGPAFLLFSDFTACVSFRSTHRTAQHSTHTHTSRLNPNDVRTTVPQSHSHHRREGDHFRMFRVEVETHSESYLLLILAVRHCGRSRRCPPPPRRAHRAMAKGEMCFGRERERMRMKRQKVGSKDADESTRTGGGSRPVAEEGFCGRRQVLHAGRGERGSVFLFSLSIVFFRLSKPRTRSISKGGEEVDL